MLLELIIEIIIKEEIYLIVLKIVIPLEKII